MTRIAGRAYLDGMNHTTSTQSWTRWSDRTGLRLISRI